MAKKDFKTMTINQIDPIAQLVKGANLTSEGEQITEERTAADINTSELKPPEGYKLNPLYIEKKTKRVQLVLQPTLYEKAKEASQAAGLSFNDFAHKALEAYLKSE